MGRSCGMLFVLSSPSGGGKSTVIKALRERDSALCYSVSATTRPPRRGEKEGIDYFFMDEATFCLNVKRGAFVEWAKVHGHYYGTLREQIDFCLKEGRHVVLDIDVQGGLNLKQKRPETVLVFLVPPSQRVLEKRLRRRGTEGGDTIARRLVMARKEMEIADRYDFQVINDRLEDTIEDIRAIIRVYG